MAALYRSISAKMVLAFFLVSIAGLAMAAGLANWLTVREFKQLSFDQARDRFIADATGYYEARGSWDGILDATRFRGGQPPLPPANFDNGPITQTLSLTSTSGITGSSTFTRRLRIPSFYFVLTNQQRNVLLPAGDYAVGSQVSAEQYSEGMPITVDGKQVGAVMVIGNAPPLGPLEERFLNRFNMALIYAALGATVFAFVLGVVLARNLTQPLRALTGAIRQVSKGNLKQRVTVISTDELGELSEAFNHMSEQLEHLIQSRRQMTADVAHDLRTPLTVIGGYIESMRDGILKPTKERLELIQTEVQHLQRLVEDLRTLSQADAGELSLNREPIDVAALIEQTARIYKPMAEKQGVTLQVETKGDATKMKTSVDPDRLSQVLGNLITNSLRYTPEGGCIQLQSWREKDQICMAVQDNGSGIATEALPFIFDRFYRADSARSNGNESGLGLAIAKSIIEAHQGQISATSEVGKGTRMCVELPVV